MVEDTFDTEEIEPSIAQRETALTERLDTDVTELTIR